MDFIPLQTYLEPAVMDTLLSFGYYRMRQSLFTTTYTLTDHQQIVKVLWARIRLKDYQLTSRHLKLSKRASRFKLRLLPAQVNAEIEALYAQYRASMDFDANESVRACILGEAEIDFFPGRMWEVRDAGRLIAAGYFDEGINSAAGILNFYHPEYAGYSLGLWLYLESVRYALSTGKTYFYPGYVALDFPKFDYKLLAGTDNMEILDAHQGIWTPYAISEHAQQR
jgi:arginyl-tRNA--protein-N-Asp/Glu arginylyltransferase